MARSEESLILQECLTYRNIVLLNFANLAQAKLFGVVHRSLSKVTSHEVPAWLYSGYHGVLSMFVSLELGFYPQHYTFIMEPGDFIEVLTTLVVDTGKNVYIWEW